MSGELARRAQEILEEALGHAETERAAFLAEACRGEPRLRSEVQALLGALDDAASFLETPAFAPRETPPPTHARSFVGTRIGRYTIDSMIASGGMGTVYLAQQSHPRRTVAVKVLRAGLASPSAQRRFEYESHILARLRHQNIAQVFDAGTHVMDGTEDRVPFFVMEHIADAQPITHYADAHELAPEARLRVFAKVCDAVHHGHQKGIIHRDIKPENLLVDGRGEPKVIDFGIARIDDDGESPGTLATVEGQIMGTLQYMSPEQCSGRPGEVDTRTDVYALGVVLYELLCGQPPYDVGTTVLEAARVICEHAPERPSTVSSAVRGDLETIVMTALAKECERRYQSAASLASDVRRYLADTPIEARPPSMLHEMRLFAKRNGLVVAMVLLALVALIGGSVTSLAFGIHASREAEERSRAEQQARHDAAVARSVNAFLEGVLQQANPQTNPLGRDVSLREALEIAAEVIPDDEPEVAAAIHAMLGTNFRTLGALERSEHHFVEAVALMRGTLGANDPVTLETMNELALTLIEQRRLDDALEQLEAILALARALPTQRRDLEGSVLNHMALTYLNMGEPALAEPHLRAAIEHGIAVYGERHAEVATMQHNMGGVYLMQGKLEGADRAFVNALAIRRELLGSVHPDIPQSLSAIVYARRLAGNVEGVDEMLREGIAIRRELYGDRHPLIARSLNNHASFLIAEERYDEALPLAREALAMFRATLPAGHPDIRNGLINLGSVLKHLGVFEESAQHLLEAWNEFDLDPAVSTARRRQTLGHVVSVYEAWKKPDEAARWQAVFDGIPPAAE